MGEYPAIGDNFRTTNLSVVVRFYCIFKAPLKLFCNSCMVLGVFDVTLVRKEGNSGQNNRTIWREKDFTMGKWPKAILLQKYIYAGTTFIHSAVILIPRK